MQIILQLNDFIKEDDTYKFGIKRNNVLQNIQALSISLASYKSFAE